MSESEKGSKSDQQHASSDSLSSSSSGSSSSESIISMPPSPDGGYGWIIVLSAFFIMVISDGFAFAFGVIYSELLHVFKASKSATSLIASLYYGVPLVCGPLSSALATKYGCRKVQIFAGLLSCTGILASAFVNSVGWLCFTFGIVAGFGMSIGYVTSVVMVAFYFEKKRALATGLAVCGSGIGTFVFAPFFEFLIGEYGWRGSFVILSAISLNLVVCGCLFRPLEFTPAEEWRRNLEKFENMSRTISRSSIPDHNRSRHASNSDDLESEKSSQDCNHPEQLSHSQVQLPTYVKKSKEIPEDLLLLIRQNGSNVQDIIKRYYQYQDESEDDVRTDSLSTKNSEKLQVTNDDSAVFLDEMNEKLVHSQIIKNHKSNGVWQQGSHSKRQPRNVRFVMQYYPMLRKDLFYRGNLEKVSNYQSRSTSCPELHVKSLDDESSDEEDDVCFPIPKLLRLSKYMKKLFRTMFDLTILTNPVFILFAISNFVLYFWYDVPYVFLADNAKELGIDHGKSAFLISILGMVNTIGQVLYGFLGDRKVSLTLLYGVSLTFAGLSVLLVPFFSSYIALCTLAGLFGLFISANYSLSTVILVEFVGMDKLTNAYGLTMLMQGIANMIGPPVAGKLSDISGSYDNAFFTGGIFICLSGFLVMVLPLVRCVKKFGQRHSPRHSRTPDINIDVPNDEMSNVQLVVTDIETTV